MSAALTNEQKYKLSKMAAEAMILEKAKALGRGEEWPWARDGDAWRRAEVAKACGKMGLRCCSQDDFGAVKGHFLNLKGETGRAFKALVHGDPVANERRQLEHNILRHCAALGKDITYANSICRRQNKRDLLDATNAQLMKVFIALEVAVRKRGKAISHQPSAISHRPSAVSRQPSAIGCQPSAVSHQPSAISRQPSAIGCQPQSQPPS